MSYVEYLVENLGLPTVIAASLVILFLVAQVVGELLELKGKIVPEFLKIRKYFKRKKEEREALGKVIAIIDEHKDMCDTMADVRRLLSDIDQHYSKDNIAKRDGWMEEVNEHIANSEERKKEQDALMRELSEKLDKNNDVTLSILIENKRSAIINFASKVIDEKFPVTKEQFTRILKTYKEYEDIIEEHGMTNGEVDIAIHIIQESYEQHMKNHTFIEDVRGYRV